MKTKTEIQIKRMVLAAMFLALGYILPNLFLNVQFVLQRCSPMHLPVLLCGFICGWPYGLAVGLLCPLLRSLTFNLPPLGTPNAFAMYAELAVYGFASGLIFSLLNKSGKIKNMTAKIYISLVSAMLLGRAVYGAVMYFQLMASPEPYTFKMFLAAAFVNAVPAIIIQLILIPVVLLTLYRVRLLPLGGSAKK